MRRRHSRSGQSLVETCCAMAMMGIVCYSFLAVTEVVLTTFRNAVIQETISSQVEPVRALLANQVRQCRFVLYSTVAGAETADSSKLVSTATTGTNLDTQFALRCTRRDGAGVFIVAWEEVSGGEPGLYIITGTGSGSNPGSAFNTPIPITKSLSYLKFDVSQGFLATTFSIPAPVAGGFMSPTAQYTRAALVDGIPAITYNVLTESTL